LDDKGQVLRAEVALEAEEVPHTAEKTIGDEAALLRGEENGEDKPLAHKGNHIRKLLNL